METYTLIKDTDFKDNKFIKEGIWIIYEGMDDKVTLILTELSQSVVGVNYGIYKDGKSKKINLYKDGNFVESYDSEISRSNLLYWSLSNSQI